jgi:hypothetical protein
LEEARAAGQFETDEAYFEAKNQLIQEYYDLFEVYADSYNAALEVDLDIQQEAWITTYDTLIAGAENWQEQLYKYTNKCEESYSHYRDVVQSESEVIQELLNNINNEVNNITEASKTLADVVEQ